MMRLIISLALFLAIIPSALGQRLPTEEEKERMRQRIGITKEQQNQIEALFMQTEQQKREIGMRMRELFRQQYALYENYDFDREQATAIRKEIMSLHRRTLLLHAENEEKLRRILNRDQFTRLRAMLKEQREQWRRDWERRRGPGPGLGRQMQSGSSEEGGVRAGIL